jgi:hypothetical protein
MAKDTPIFDFDNPGVRMMAKRMIDALRGLCVFHAHRLRDQRTLTQLAYLWSVVYPHVAAGLTEVWGEGEVDAEGAHIECGLMFLSKPTVDRRTGEVPTGPGPVHVGTDDGGVRGLHGQGHPVRFGVLGRQRPAADAGPVAVGETGQGHRTGRSAMSGHLGFLAGSLGPCSRMYCSMNALSTAPISSPLYRQSPRNLFASAGSIPLVWKYGPRGLAFFSPMWAWLPALKQVSTESA